jgi:putative transposon-encoded protein
LEGSDISESPENRPKRIDKMVNNVTEPVEELPSEFKVKGFEMIDREVKQSGNTGRVYLPKNWIGSKVKIIRVSKIKKISNQTKE